MANFLMATDKRYRPWSERTVIDHNRSTLGWLTREGFRGGEPRDSVERH
jgi:hypothetical protein